MVTNKDKMPLAASRQSRRALDRLTTPQSLEVRPHLEEQERHKLHHELQIHRLELEMQNVELRKARDEVEILNADLAGRVSELASANIELEAFNYTVSHDLSKPLTVISGYCQLLSETCGDQLDERSRGYIREIHDGTRRMNMLIASLLDFSRVTRAEMAREKVDLSAMAEAAAGVVELSVPDCRATFRIADGMTADADAALLRIVLDNLIGNAWKFSGNNEETIIEFGMTEVEGNPVFFVRDNGPGFDMVYAGKLFLPFQRLSGTEVEGHGIGLATVERIIRRHGGRIWAESQPGKGATFFFTLK